MIGIEDITTARVLIHIDQEKTIIQTEITETVDVITHLILITLHRVHQDTVVDRDQEVIATVTLMGDHILVIITHEDLRLLVLHPDHPEDLLTAITARAHRIPTARDVHLHQSEAVEVAA
jgi:hypothetical protein